MSFELAISGSTLIAVLILAVQLGSIKEQHKLMWRHFKSNVLDDNSSN